MNPDAKARQDAIFDLIVRSYIETAEPVGSTAICKRFNLSSASIRNVMSELEERGLLAQPHTSAGRVPTDKGYRYWVDYLMKPMDLAPKEKNWVKSEIAKARTIEDLGNTMSKTVSELTEQPALTYIPNVRKVSFLSHLLEDLIEDEKLQDFFREEPGLFIEGASRIFDSPEFQDLKRMKSLLHALDRKSGFVALFVKDLDEEGLHVHIGSEMEDFDNLSFVVKDCSIGGLAVLGPTRMHYPRVVSVVQFVSDSVHDALKKL